MLLIYYQYSKGRGLYKTPALLCIEIIPAQDEKTYSVTLSRPKGGTLRGVRYEMNSYYLAIGLLGVADNESRLYQSAVARHSQQNKAYICCTKNHAEA